MKHINFLLLTLTIGLSTFAQDIVIKKNGDEIKAKVLEVALTIVKYKKFDNLNGPTFEILKSEIFMIKYENGTKDVINPIEQKKEVNKERIENTDNTKKDNSSLAFTGKHRSTTIAYGVSALFGGITSFDGSESSMVIGPLLVSFDKALSDKFSIAFRPPAMYYSYKYTYYDGSGRLRTSTSDLFFGGLQVRVDFHFATSQKLDPYFGLGGGVGYFFGGNDLSGLKGTYPIYGGGFGIKSYGKGKNAFLVELGYDSYSYLKIGYVFGGHK